MTISENRLKIKRLIAILLTITMLVGCLPASLAEDLATPTDLEEEPVLRSAPMLGAGAGDGAGDSTEPVSEEGTGGEQQEESTETPLEGEDLQALVDKMISASSGEDKVVTIVLKKGTVFNNTDLNIEGSDKVSEVVIKTEDAGDDGLSADGSTKLNLEKEQKTGDKTEKVPGTANFRNLTVTFKGLLISGKIALENATLNFFGTKADDAVDVTLDNKSTANIATGGGNDSVTAKDNGGTLDVRTGDGDDKIAVDQKDGTVNVLAGDGDDAVTLSQKNGTMTVDTGDGKDTVTIDTDQNNGGTMTVETGAGEDTVTATLNRGELNIDTGDDDDKVTLTDKAPEGKLIVETGAGDDTVALDAQTAGQGIEIRTGVGDDTVTLTSSGSKTTADALPNAITVDLGAGINAISLSMDLSNAVKKIGIDGSAGNDHLHITGALQELSGTVTKNAEGDAREMKLTGAAGKVLTIVTSTQANPDVSSIESITDDLTNKKTVKLTPAADGSMTFDKAESFTNYLITAPSSTLKNIKISALNNMPTILSNVLIDTDTTADGDNKLVINNGTVIDARGLKLALRARNIEVNGILMADLVQLEALDGTGMYSRNFSDMYSAKHESMNFAAAAAESLGGLAWDMINIKDKATVTVGKTGSIQASGDVIMLARVEQSGTMISEIPINAVNVKIGEAVVDIQGKVYAGVTTFSSDPATAPVVNAGNGSVRADAQVKITTGKDDFSDSVVAGILEGLDAMPKGFPIGVTVAYGDAQVNVAQGAVVKAARDVSLAAKSEESTATRADSGLAGLPAAIAVSVLVNGATAKIDGEVTAVTGDVRLEADAEMEAKTLADKGEGHDNKSGGFIAVSVALQDALAKIGTNATVDAGGNVRVESKASEKVENTATSSEEPEDEKGEDSTKKTAVSEVTNFLKEELWPKIKDKMDNSPDAQEKLEKAMKKLSSGSHGAQLDEDAQRKGEVKITENNSGSNVTYTVEIKPWTGYKASEVTALGYNPGDNAFRKCTVSKISDTVYRVTPKSGNTAMANVIIFVEYEEDSSYEEPTAADLFDENKKDEDDDVDLQKMLDDLANSTDDGSELDEALKELEDAEDIIKLQLQSGILTYETEEGEDGQLKSRSDVLAGEKLRLLPNPPSGQKLKQGSLKVTYYVKAEDGKSTQQKTTVVNADSKGRYFFTVPADAISKFNGVEYSISVKAEFESTGTDDKKGDEDQNEIVGAVAVVVADNDSQALIDQGAVVTSGKKTDVHSETVTNIKNKADGSPAGKKEESSSSSGSSEKAEGKAIQRPATENYETVDSGGRARFGLIIDETINGKVAYTKTQQNADNDYRYTFIPSTTVDGYAVAHVLLTYISNGEQKTAELTPANGVYSVNLADAQYKMDDGTTAHLSVTFAKEGEYGVTTEGAGQGTTVVLSHPIKISYNKKKGDNTNNTTIDTDLMGKVLYEGVSDGKYSFSVTTARSYILEGNKLTASWTDASGKAQTKELTYSNGRWLLDPADIPAGAVITVSGKFADDLRDFKTADGIKDDGSVMGKDPNGNDVKVGTVKLMDKQVKDSDKAEIVVKPEPGYSVDKIVVTYKHGTVTETMTWKPGEGSSTYITKGSGNVYTVTFFEALAAGSEVTVNAEFAPKTIPVYAGAGDQDDKPGDNQKYTLSEKRVAVGDTVTVTLPAKLVKEGYKISKLTVTGGTVEVKGNTFTVKEGTTADTPLTVSIETAKKAVETKEAKLENGTVTPASALADWNETVTVNIKPAKDFRVKSGTLKAVVKADDGSYTEEIYLSRQNDTTYTFAMPSNPGKPVTITFEGEFEPGQSSSSELNTSMGAAIAVTVANSESRGEIKGNVTAGGDVNVGSKASGEAKTETKAGYSKGNIGIGGAVSVQVASMDSKALLHNTASVQLDGKLSVDSASDLTFEVNADASGKKEAKKAGVGAGIAVAVNGSDAFAAVQDGTKLSKNKKDAIKGISITANQKVKDTLSAKAGAAGGTAVVPVAAVDVTFMTAEAYMGKVNNGELKLTEDLAVTSAINAEHTVSADASATGKGVGVGAAIVVTVLGDEASAKLNQTVNANKVTVASETVSKVKDTATAGASGGKKEGESKSPDKQADGLMGAAGNLAGKNKSSGASGGKIDKMTKNRQKAETGEGTVGVAGAVAVNVQSSESLAEVLNGVNVTAKDAMAVTSRNGTTSVVKANASTTNSDYGVGVGAAVNIITLNNIAKIGNGKIEAGSLKVAATTIMTEPEKKAEEKKEEKKADTKDGLAKQLGEKVGEYVNDLVKEVGLDDYISPDLLGEIVGPVVTNATNELIKASGIGELLGDGDLSAKYNKAKESLSEIKDGFLALPELLIEPLMDMIRGVIDLDGMTSEEIDALEDRLLDEMKTALIAHLQNAGEEILNAAKDGMIEYFRDNAREMLSELLDKLFTDGVKGVGDGISDDVKKIYEKAKGIIVASVKEHAKTILTDAFTEALLKTGIPGVTEKTKDSVIKAFKTLKNAYTQESMSDILTSVSTHITETFRKNVFDYEAMFSKLGQVDFKKTIVDGLKNAAKAAGVTLTNEVLGALSDHFAVALEPKEEKATGHVVDTQAIAGAGAREVGIAGSAAIIVLNGETSATIAEGGTVTVEKDMTVQADVTRSVKSVASAAVDSKGNASSNKNEAKKEEKGSGGSNEAGLRANCNHVSMETTAGAELFIREGDIAKDKPIIYIKVKDGYKLPEKDGKPYANFVYTKDGEEVKGTIELTKESDGTYSADAKTGALASLDDDKDVKLSLEPIEILNAINLEKEPMTDGQVDVEEGAVTVSVEGREVEKAENGDQVIKARVGETVKIRIAKADGRKLAAVGYSWTDKNGKTHDVELNNISSSKETKEFTLVTSNDEEFIYTFTMPEGEVTAIVVAFMKGEEEKTESKTSAKDENGKGVGVGAAFSMVYGDNAVKAEIGKRILTAGSLSVTASDDHKEDISAAAGSDPMAGEADTTNTKKYSVDASVALNILDSTVKAGIASGSTVTTKGYKDGETDKDGDLTVKAAENAVTLAHSSAFAIGGKTAVGATASINIAESNVTAEMAGSATVAGSAAIGASSHSEDVTKAMATAMGADIGRNLAKLGEKAENLEEKSNKLLDGSYVDDMGKKGDNKSKTKTGENINNRLDSKKQKEGKETNGNSSTSSNVLRSMGVKSQGEDAGNEGTQEAEDFINKETGDIGKNVGLGGQQQGSSWQVAAAVGVTVAEHNVNTVVGKINATKAIEVTAGNTGNFNTMGTGAAMSLAKKSNSIAAGVAVSVNENKAKVTAKDDLVAGGNLTVKSTLTQNQDGDFAGLLAAQALAGSVAGSESSVSIGGAISFVYSEAESTVDIAGGTSAAKRQLEGADINIEATDKSKLAVRAGGLSFSRGSTVGMGIASATVISSNTVTAALGDETSIYGNSFRLNAEKIAVTQDDYKNPLDLSYLVTDSSKLSDEQRKNADTGLIDIHKGDDDKSYKLEVNLSSDKLLHAVDGLNYFSSQNTYVEAMAGSVMTGFENSKSKLSLAGSFAVAWTDNEIAATIGKNVNVILTKDDDHTGDMTVTAANKATTRILAGSMSAAPSKASVGMTIAFLRTDDSVKAETGSGADIVADGSFTHTATTEADIQLFTAAMAVAAGVKIKAAAGGAINVILSRNKTENIIGDNAIIDAGENATIGSATKQDLMAISGSANVAAGAGEGSTYAAGGTVNVIIDKSISLNDLSTGLTLTAGKDANISSKVEDQLISGTAALSVAASKGGKAGAGTVNVNISKSSAKTKTGQADVTATTGDLNATATNDTWMLNAALSVAGGAKNALGAAFNVNVFNREAIVEMESGSLEAGNNLKVQADGRNTAIMAGLSLSAAGTGSTISGTVAFMLDQNKINTTIAEGITAHAGGNAVLESYFSDFTVAAAGNIGISLGGGAYGATIVTTIKNNNVSTTLAESTITADAQDSETTKTLTGEETLGVYVGAKAEETQFFAGAGIAASSDRALNGEVAVLVNNNTVRADAADATLEALTNMGSIKVTAKDKTKQTVIAGGLNLSLSDAVGAAVVTLVSNKTVDAKAHDMHANRNVDVTAENYDDISTLAVSVGGATGNAIEIGVAVQVLKSTVNAIIGSTVTADTGSVNLKSVNDTNLLNAAGAIAGSTGTMAVTPVGAITYFQGESNAILKTGSTVTAKQGDINIGTTSNKDVNLYTLGISASTGFGLSGAANILVSKDKAYAGTEHIKPENMATATLSTLKANGGSLNITADSEYRLRAISGAVGVGGSMAVGVNAVVSVLKSSATAELTGNATVNKELNVLATANRDVINAAATLAAGQMGGGITVMVLVAGTKMSQDAADMVAYGNSEDQKNKDGFDAASFMKNAEKAGVDMKRINADESDDDRKLSGDILAEDIAGNGHRESKESVGSRDEETGEATFDGASGYRSSEIDTKANDTEDKDNRGENLQAEDTEDVENAKNMNTYVYEDDPDDAVIARILSGSTVSAEKVSVIARQGVAADLIGAAVGVGQIGGGISTVVAILRSNVLASSDANITKATGGVTVSAQSKSGSFYRDEDGSNRDDTVLDLMSNKPQEELKEDATEEEKKEYEERKKNAPKEKQSTLEELKDKFTSRNIRAFSVALGAGQVGLGVSVAVVLTDNVTQAILGGTVENAGDVTVSATHNYGSVMAATGALAAGQFAAGASVSVAQANGTVNALIRDKAKVTTNAGKDIKVTTDSGVGVDALAVTAGVGQIALNAGVALSFNRLQQETGIGQGTTINSGRDIIVSATSDTEAHSYLLGVSVGGAAIAVNAAVSDVAAKINTHIGGDSADSKITATRNITMENTTTSAAIPKVLAVAAGGAAVGGNVLLAFNDTTARAEVKRSTVKAVDMTVSGDLSGEATSDLTAIQVGLLAVGISVNYADMRAENRASVTDSEIDVSGSLNILTGAGKNNATSATAKTLAGNVGLISVGVNAAIARNNTKNYAILETSKTVKTGKDLTVHGAGTSTAHAHIKGFDLSALGVALSAVVALNDADARSQVKLNNDVTVNGMATFNATQNATTTADMLTGGGSIISAKVNAAVAYGRANALVDVETHGQKTEFHGLTSKVTGHDETTADIANLSFDAISAAARFSGAYSQDVFRSKIVMSGKTTDIHGDVNVNTDYDITTKGTVTPSLGGVDISLASLAINASIAKNTAGLGAYFEAIKGNATVDGDLNVIVTGSNEADATVETAKISVGGISLGANIAKSDLSASQAAYLRVGGILGVTGKANIQSIANKVLANAKIGAAGGSESLSLKLANLDVSHAIARENMNSSASVLGGPIDTGYEYYTVDEGHYETKREGHWDYELTLSGYRVERDANGNAQKELVTWVYYDTGEMAMLNALGQEVWNNFEEKNDGKRKVDYEEEVVGDKYRYSKEYNDWVEEDVTVWVPNKKQYRRPIDLYNPEDNVLTAAALNIESAVKDGTKTGATARTDGAKSFGIATAGSLDAKAYSTDMFGVVFEGMKATITGAATLRAESSTVAQAVGSMPGSLSLADVSGSDVTAQVGQRGDRQIVGVLIGQGNSLTAGSIDIKAKNIGSATALLDQGTAFALGKVRKSTQPTESWYNTFVTIGSSAMLKATNGDVTISTTDAPTAESKVNSTNISLLLNYNNMMGKNSIDQETNLDIGKKAKITASMNVTIKVDQHTVATAETIMKGGGIIDSSTAKAQNDINRVARINVDEDAEITATGGTLTIQTISGANDNIYTKASSTAVAGVALANAKAYTNLTAYAEVNVAQGVKLNSNNKMTIDARATSYNPSTRNEENKVIGAGVRTVGIVDAGGLIPLPQTVAKNTLFFQSYVNLNKRDDKAPNTAKRKVTLNSAAGDTVVNASNEGMTIYAKTRSVGKGLAGTSNANSWNAMTLVNAIWIDDADLTGNNVLVYAENGKSLKNANLNDPNLRNNLHNVAGLNNILAGLFGNNNNADKIHVICDSYAELLSATGRVAPTAKITGETINQIRSHDVKSVSFTARDNGIVFHKTSNPFNSVWQEASAQYERVEIWGISLTKADDTVVKQWGYFNRCDFCGEGVEVDIDGTWQETLEKRYEDAFKKILSPISDIERMVDNLGAITKARYGEEDYAQAGKIYVLDVKSMLDHDVTINRDKMKDYRLWTNTKNYMTVYLMPNAARLYTNGTSRLQYAVDVISGKLFEEGWDMDIEILTALTANAMKSPVIPIGSTGSLDLNTGLLTLPDQADYELYLHEISADWLISSMKNGFIRTLVADPETVTDFALNGGNEMPSGQIVEQLNDGEPIDLEGFEDWTLYWIGKTPETAEDPDEPLIALFVNKETDEVDAFRTSVNMIKNGEAPVDVSLFLYRDSKSDRIGEEKYNAMFFDTPGENDSLVKAVTSVLLDRTLETPLSLRIVLRGYYLDGADAPVYVLGNHAFILCDGTDGEVNVLGGYHATFDGDVFDSNYTRIEGISTGNLAVTIKEGQPVWPEWTGKDTAEDIGGKQFELVDEEWNEIKKEDEDAGMKADEKGEDEDA